MKNYMKIDSPAGRLITVEKDGKLMKLIFERNYRGEDFGEEKNTELLAETKRQLEEYFDGKRKTFDIPLGPEGTDFQLKCWKALQGIPYGQVISYKELATRVGNPKACRAVGGANNRNPISIIVPCHRVIGADGSLTGYGGGIENKEKLLELERKYDIL